MDEWCRRQLTTGTRDFLYHAHSYYDIPVFDPASQLIGAHRMTFAERPPTPDDAVTVGYVDCDDDTGFRALGASQAWSWQQGPMVQWRGAGRCLLWNDRHDDQFITRVHDLDTDSAYTLPRATYAVAPDDSCALSLNMARLDTLRPGYGYPGGAGALLDERAPETDGVWRMSFEANQAPMLILSIARAVSFIRSQFDVSTRAQHDEQRYHYWFNHAKIAPDSRRFTVKLRFKRMDGDWNDAQGVSLTCGLDGEDIRLLAEGTSHVIWKDRDTLYMWQNDGFYLYLDASPRGECLSQIGAGIVDANAHLRYLSNPGSRFIFDTPYRETVDLYISDDDAPMPVSIDRFTGHRPRNGPYRCDLHPCPSPDGRRVVVTSMEDGGRQIYLLEKTGGDR